MDVTLSPVYYYYTGSGYSGSVINGFIDGAVDVFQTIAYFS